MALPTAYLTSVKNLSAIFTAIQGAQAPDKFTQAFLESLEFKATNDRLVIGLLKALKFLDDSGKPIDRYFRFLDQTQGEKVLAEAIRDAYQDLFRVNIKANELSKSDVTNKMKTLSQGAFSESVLDKMSTTFTTLVKLADFKSSANPSAAAAALPIDEGNAEMMREERSERSETRREDQHHNVKLGGLVYNIQIVLPESRDPAVYDALFQSLRRHLL